MAARAHAKRAHRPPPPLPSSMLPTAGPSLAQHRILPSVLQKTLRSIDSLDVGRPPSSVYGDSRASPASLSMSRPFTGDGSRAVWTPNGSRWERQSVAVFDRGSSAGTSAAVHKLMSSGGASKSVSRRRRKPGKAPVLESLSGDIRCEDTLSLLAPRRSESLGGAAQRPSRAEPAARDPPVPWELQDEIKRMVPIAQAAEAKRILCVAELHQMQYELAMNLPSMLSEGRADEEKEVRLIFDGIDLDGNGTLDATELATLAERLLHRPLSASEVEAAMATIDEDKSGEIEFDEFLAWWQSGDTAAPAAEGGRQQPQQRRGPVVRRAPSGKLATGAAQKRRQQQQAAAKGGNETTGAAAGDALLQSLREGLGSSLERCGRYVTAQMAIETKEKEARLATDAAAPLVTHVRELLVQAGVAAKYSADQFLARLIQKEASRPVRRETTMMEGPPGRTQRSPSPEDVLGAGRAGRGLSSRSRPATVSDAAEIAHRLGTRRPGSVGGINHQTAELLEVPSFGDASGNGGSGSASVTTPHAGPGSASGIVGMVDFTGEVQDRCWSLVWPELTDLRSDTAAIDTRYGSRNERLLPKFGEVTELRPEMVQSGSSRHSSSSVLPSSPDR